MDYLYDHWRGRHPLARAFWGNFLIPFVLIAMIEPWIRPATAGNVDQSVLAGLFILLTHAVILPWQVVGLWRSCRRHLDERGDLVMVTFAQGAVFIALVTAIGATTTTVQRIFGFGSAGDLEQAPLAYSLSIVNEADGSLPAKRAVLIDGAFDVGLSRALETLLAGVPNIDAVILNSDGGRVFEARGVARQIADADLDTVVFERCRSACTIAFIAGRNRTLGQEGQLGFHSYRLDGVAAFVDPEEEQGKDREFFIQQGVEPDFVTRAFATPHDDIWHPGGNLLLTSGVIHELIGDHR